MGLRGATSRCVALSITLLLALRAAAAPTVHFFSPCLKHGAVRVVDGERRVEERDSVLEGCRVPTKTLFCRTKVRAAVAMLYADLATCFL